MKSFLNSSTALTLLYENITTDQCKSFSTPDLYQACNDSKNVLNPNRK